MNIFSRYFQVLFLIFFILSTQKTYADRKITEEALIFQELRDGVFTFLVMKVMVAGFSYTKLVFY